MPHKTISLIDFLAAMTEALQEQGVNVEKDNSLDEVPVQVLFKSYEGTPIDFPVSGVGVKTDDNGQVIALVISCTQEGDFSAAAQNS